MKQAGFATRRGYVKISVSTFQWRTVVGRQSPAGARMGYEDEIATFGDASKDAQPSDGMLLVYLVELDDNDTAENSEPSSATQHAEKRW